MARPSAGTQERAGLAPRNWKWGPRMVQWGQGHPSELYRERGPVHREALEAGRPAHVGGPHHELFRLHDALRQLGACQAYLLGPVAQGKGGWGSELDIPVVLETNLPFAGRLALRDRAALPRIEGLGEEIASSDGSYVPTRYPNGLPDSIPARAFGMRNAGEVLRIAREALGFVAARISHAP